VTDLAVKHISAIFLCVQKSICGEKFYLLSVMCISPSVALFFPNIY